MRNVVFGLACSAMIAASARAPTTHVHMIGDSTMADKATPEINPERGWGQLFPRFFDEHVAVYNHALNGRSTKSFIEEGHWAAVVSVLEPGDYLFIEFGHNDEKKEDSTRYAAPRGDYRRNLERFVDEARARGATPILLTPIVRRKFDARGMLEPTHGEYPAVVRELATKKSVAFIDLERLTETMVSDAGPEGSKRIYCYVDPGTSKMYPEGHKDDTHLSVAGATEVAALVANALRASGLPLARYLKQPERF